MTTNETTKLTMRVSAVQRDRYTLIGDMGELSGKMRGTLYNSGNYPVVGDYVEVLYNPQGDSFIESIHERKSYLSRPDRSGHADGYVKTLVEQPIAANFDFTFIVTALDRNYNIGRIARYVSLTLQGGGIPVVILSKADLCENITDFVTEVRSLSDKAEVVAVSALTGLGMEKLERYFGEGVTIVLIGSSGVGKSTLLNAVAGKEVMRTSFVRAEDSKGRHTTTHRQLFILDCGATIIDTPGMREIGVCDTDKGIDNTFSDISELITQCRYSDCHHDTETDCAVKIAIQSGELSEKRWKLYLRLTNENSWAKRKKEMMKKR